MKRHLEMSEQQLQIYLCMVSTEQLIQRHEQVMENGMVDIYLMEQIVQYLPTQEL